MIPKKYQILFTGTPKLIGRKIKHIESGNVFIPLEIKMYNGKVSCERYKSVECYDGYINEHYFIGDGGTTYWKCYEVVDEHITNWKGEFK